MNMICLNLLLLYKLVYMNFRIILTQFYINFLRQEHQIDVSFNAWDSQVSSYTPFHFSFTISLIILNQFHVTLVKTVFFRLFVSSSTCNLYSIYETKQDATFWKVYSPEHFLPWNYSKYYKKVFLNFNLSGQSMRLNGNAYLTKLKLHVSRFSVKSGVFLQKIFF